MFASDTAHLFGLNLAIAVSLCAAIALGVSACFKSLPKGYATLVVGLIGSLLAPLLVGLGAALSLGIMPAIEVTSVDVPVATEVVLQPMPQFAGKSELTQALPEVMPPVAEPALEPRPAKQRPIHVEPSVGEFPNASSDASWWWPSIGTVLLSLWSVGSITMLVRQAHRIYRCRRFLKTCRPIQDECVQESFRSIVEKLGVHPQIELLESDALPAPVVVSCGTPRVILPADIQLSLSPSQLRSVLAHELAHVQRRDHWIAAAQATAEIGYWWNPLFHSLSRRMNALREMICDDIATASESNSQQYAQSLVRMIENTVARQFAVNSLGISRSRISEMERRVRRILTTSTHRVDLRITGRFLVGLSAMSVLFIAGLLFAQVPESKRPQESQNTKQASAEEQASSSDETQDEQLGQDDAPPLTISGRVVDSAGNPIQGAKVHAQSNHLGQIDAQRDSDDAGRFQFDLRFSRDRVWALRIWAESADGSQLGFLRFPQTDKGQVVDQAEIKLEPCKSANVHVVDGNGDPIPDAKVAIQLEYPNTLGALKTDSNGVATTLLPQSEKILAVVAWKDGKGLDYQLYTLPHEQKGDLVTKAPKFPFADFETLTLEGTAPVTVTVTDTEGHPLPNTRLYVWLLQKESQADQLNLSYFSELLATRTNSAGRASFDWFPAWQKSLTTIWPTADGHVRVRGMYDPAVQNGEIDIQLDRLMPLRGTVTFADGTPAAGIAVAAAGAGYTFDGFREVTRTDKSGRYEILAAPYQIYMLYVQDEQWAAPSQSGFAVLPNQAVDEHHFQLRRATRIHGRVLDKNTGNPVPGKLIYLTHHGIDLNSMGEDILPNPEKSRRWVSPMRQLNATSQEDGTFEFFVGDGDYNLFVQGFDAEKFTIDEESEKHVDLAIEVQSRIELSGSVVLDETNAPVRHAKIEAVSQNFRQHNDWQARADDQGKFKVQRFAEPTYIHVLNVDETLGGVATIAADDTNKEIRLKTLGSATGRLLTEDGTDKAPHVKLRFGIRITDEKGSLSSSRFGDVVTTDSEGRFTLPKLVPGWEYECTLEDHPGGYVLNVANVQVEPGQTVELGELKTPTAPKPYVPPTLDERIQEAFDVAGTPVERFERAAELIRMVNQNLLIVFGKPADSRVRRFMQIRYEDANYRAFSDDFRIMAIPTDTDRLAAAQTLVDTRMFDLNLNAGRDPLFFVLVDSQSKTLAILDSTQLCEGETFSKELLFSTLEKFRTKPMDAQVLLDEALKKAAKENKRVHWIVETNLSGPFYCAQQVYPTMKAQGGGKIITIGSMASIFGLPFAAPYAATKGGIVQLSRVLATAWAADNIQVNAVLPGWIDTDLTRNARTQVDGLHERVETRTPAARWGNPADFAGIAVFLASNASDFVTGTAIPVDGGYSIMGG